MAAILAAPAFALAEIDRSVDTQLVHPVIAAEAGVVVDSPLAGDAYRVATGVSWQYERQPLDYYLNGQLGGAAIVSRSSLHLGASVAVSPRSTFWVRAWGSQSEAGDMASVAPVQQLALGDLALGAKSCWVRREHFGLGPGIGFWIPIGSEDSWVSERSLRYAPAVLASLGGERLELLGNLGIMARAEVISGGDFLASPEVTAGAALRVSATPWLAGLVEASSRHGTGNFLRAGAENPVEVKAGVRLAHPRWGRMDLMAGTGLTHGYGASDLRLMVSLLGITPPLGGSGQPAVEVGPPPAVAARPDPSPPAAAPPAVLEVPTSTRVERGHVVMDAPLAFEAGNATLLPDSRALLPEVAAVINAYPQIELLVVEGHADETGSAGSDFDLSLQRARVVFEGLVALSVRPGRLAYRGMGSAAPQGAAGARGVDLVITHVRALQEGPALDDGSAIVLPWSGDLVAAPVTGEKLLGQDGHPILVDRPVPEIDQGHDLPSAESFERALDDQDTQDDQETREEEP